jgi:hypothetical protein
LSAASCDTELHNIPLAVAQLEGRSRTVLAVDVRRPVVRDSGERWQWQEVGGEADHIEW